MLTNECGFSECIECDCPGDALKILRNNPKISLAVFNHGEFGNKLNSNLRIVSLVCPAVRILIVGDFNYKNELFAALNAGVHGYIPRRFGKAEISRAFEIVSRGGFFLPTVIDEQQYQCRVAQESRKQTQEVAESELTSREKYIFDAIRRGETNREIAEVLRLTEGTVKNLAYDLYRKLGVSKRTDLINHSVVPRD
ncbi:response regulator transcription factor [Methylobacterium soli]|uniref:response regulator transcription factor n=1 Tax=Methylobacterium soli TaxID=553447 RepID=UPI00177C75E3|nr:response regulator transcription factor [Methylobacterium soli]